ncbi:MAG: choice-of-anchor P family protein [Armatimonas sp.]
MFKTRLVLIVCAVVACIAPAKAQFFYNGRGTGLDANILSLVDVKVADTGLLPINGGTLNVSVATGSLTSGGTTVADTGVITTGTTGGGGTTTSFAEVNNLRLLTNDLFPAFDFVRATTVRSDASAVLGSASGSSLISNLTVLGIPVTVTGAPNQVYGVPGVLNLTINRQTVTNGVLRVDALYLDVLSGANVGTVAVSSSYAGVAPAPEPSSLALAGLVIPGALAVLRRRRHL